MASYEICYLASTGALLGTFSVTCAGDTQARVLAHAMRLPGTKRMEVWNGAALIYERPALARAATIEALRPAPTLHAAE